MLQGYKEYDLFDTIEMTYVIENKELPDIVIKQRGFLFSSIWNGFENLTQDIVLLQKFQNKYHRYIYLYGICKIITPCKIVLFEKTSVSHLLYPIGKIYGEHIPEFRTRVAKKGVKK